MRILLCFKEAASTALLLIPNTQLFWQMINGPSLAVARFQLGQELQTHLGKGREGGIGTLAWWGKENYSLCLCFRESSSSWEWDAECRAGPCPETEELKQNNRVGTLDGPRQAGWAGAGAPIHPFDFIHTYSCIRDIS